MQVKIDDDDDDDDGDDDSFIQAEEFIPLFQDF